jgi:hypothetical protein
VGKIARGDWVFMIAVAGDFAHPTDGLQSKAAASDEIKLW